MTENELKEIRARGEIDGLLKHASKEIHKGFCALNRADQDDFVNFRQQIIVAEICIAEAKQAFDEAEKLQ